MAKAEGGIFSTVRITNAKGDTIGADFAPQFVNSVSDEAVRHVHLHGGPARRNAREAAIDSSNADKEDIGIGDTVGVAGDAPLTKYEVVGINKLGDTSTGGSSTVTLSALQEEVRVPVGPGVERVAAVVGVHEVDPAGERRAACSTAVSSAIPPACAWQVSRQNPTISDPSAWCTASKTRRDPVGLASHRVAAAGGVLDEQRDLEVGGLDGLAPVVEPLLRVVGGVDVAAVDDQPLRPRSTPPRPCAAGGACGSGSGSGCSWSPR